MFAAIRSKLAAPAIVTAWREKKAAPGSSDVSGNSSPSATPTTPAEELEAKELETQPSGCGARSKACKWTKVLKNPARLFKSARNKNPAVDADEIRAAAAAKFAAAAAAHSAAAAAAYAAAAAAPPCRPSPPTTTNSLPAVSADDAALAGLDRFSMGGSDEEIRQLLWEVGGQVMAETNRKAAAAAAATKTAAAAAAATATATPVEEENPFASFATVVRDRKPVAQKPSLENIQEGEEQETEEEIEEEVEEESPEEVEWAWSRRRLYVPGDIFYLPGRRPVRRLRIDEPPPKPTLADLEASIAAWR